MAGYSFHFPDSASAIDAFSTSGFFRLANNGQPELLSRVSLERMSSTTCEYDAGRSLFIPVTFVRNFIAAFLAYIHASDWKARGDCALPKVFKTIGINSAIGATAPWGPHLLLEFVSNWNTDLRCWSETSIVLSTSIQFANTVSAGWSS